MQAPGSSAPDWMSKGVCVCVCVYVCVSVSVCLCLCLCLCVSVSVSVSASASVSESARVCVSFPITLSEFCLENPPESSLGSSSSLPITFQLNSS